MLPPPIRQLIVDRKAEYPALTPHELATLCYVASGRRPSAHTIQRVLATGPKPSLATPLGLSRKVDDFQDTGPTGGTGLRIKSPPVVARTSLSSKVRESPSSGEVWDVGRLIGCEQFESCLRAEHRAAQVHQHQHAVRAVRLLGGCYSVRSVAVCQCCQTICFSYADQPG
jgi:hypothetical protein